MDSCCEGNSLLSFCSCHTGSGVITVFNIQLKTNRPLLSDLTGGKSHCVSFEDTKHQKQHLQSNTRTRNRTMRPADRPNFQTATIHSNTDHSRHGVMTIKLSANSQNDTLDSSGDLKVNSTETWSERFDFLTLQHNIIILSGRKV